jgi:hypothetical protein
MSGSDDEILGVVNDAAARLPQRPAPSFGEWEQADGENASPLNCSLNHTLGKMRKGEKERERESMRDREGEKVACTERMHAFTSQFL